MNVAWKYELAPSAWGEVAIVWRDGPAGKGEMIQRILLPGGEGEKIAAIIRPEGETARPGDLDRLFPGAVRQASAIIRKFRAKLARALAGEAVSFSLGLLDMNSGTAFEKAVWTACARIPRGAVVSYGELAACAGSPRGARAVGQVMARNPFPIVIPCHRVIRGDGTLGGYGGGLTMKKALLAREGVRFRRAAGYLCGNSLSTAILSRWITSS